MNDAPLSRSFYNRDCLVVARELLGKRLLRRTEEGLAGGTIVEVEAYLGPADPASHSYRGMTRRNRSMFGPPGHAYVYSIHSRWCMNVVVQPEGTPHAALIRALEPQIGLDLMRQRRQREKLLELTRGPARLCEALAIDRQLDGWDVTLGKDLWLAEGEKDESEASRQIAVSPRIGVTAAHDLPLRFFYANCPYVSGRRRA